MPPATTTRPRPRRTEPALKPAERPPDDDGTLMRVFLAVGVLTTVAWGIALIALVIWAISAV